MSLHTHILTIRFLGNFSIQVKSSILPVSESTPGSLLKFGYSTPTSQPVECLTNPYSGVFLTLNKAKSPVKSDQAERGVRKCRNVFTRRELLH